MIMMCYLAANAAQAIQVHDQVLTACPVSQCLAAGWDGGLVLVSHDFRLISQVANEIWEVRDGGVHRWRQDIVSYKKHLKANM